MKLLILTQKVNSQDSFLSFFHRWIVAFAKKVNSIVVVCLEEGSHHLPENVRVLSLGKEERQSRLQYIIHFYWYIWHERKNYDTVFVHMNQEYVLLGGLLWRIMGKKVTMWRNHHEGTIMTDIAGMLCHKVFCTSKYSYTASFKNTTLMPIGIDIDFYTITTNERRSNNSILFLGRIAPVKKVDLLIQALASLKEKGVAANLSIYGDTLPKDAMYGEGLRVMIKEKGLSSSTDGNPAKVNQLPMVTFHGGVSSDQTPEIFQSHSIFVNLSSSGMYDKTIFESAACGALSLSCNENLRGVFDDRLLFKEGILDDLVSKLHVLLALSPVEYKHLQQQTSEYVKKTQSLDLLTEILVHELGSKT